MSIICRFNKALQVEQNHNLNNFVKRLKMEAITIHPKDKEQFTTVTTILKALKIPFKKMEPNDPYDPEFVKEILQAKEDIKNGKGSLIKTEDLWK